MLGDLGAGPAHRMPAVTPRARYMRVERSRAIPAEVWRSGPGRANVCIGLYV